MILQEMYRFQENDFYKTGQNAKTELLFTELINQFEMEFNKKYPFCVPNYLFANYSVMQIIKTCTMNHDASPEETNYDIEDYGMDLLDQNMEVNFDINLKVDKKSSRHLVYAISSSKDEEEPLFLIIDENVYPNTLVLKYITDENDDGESLNLNSNCPSYLIESPIGQLV